MTKSDDIVSLNKEFTFFSWSIQNQVQPIPVDRAEGVYFFDPEGKRYLDFSSQLMNTNIGHQHPYVIEAIKQQADKLCFVHPGNATEIRGLLGKKLAEVTPGNLKKTFFTLGGSEANENAIKIARYFTGRHKILARYRSYHGATHGSIALTGDYRRLAVEPAMPGVVHFLDPFCYRCPFGQKRESCKMECLAHLEDVIKYEGTDRIAAIIMEGVVGSNGLIIPPDGYWAGVRAMCDKFGILLISDEVMSGWGRTGEWFAVDNWNIVPDMITTAKGITSGYLPLGAVIVSDQIAAFFDGKMLSAGLTYNGHALSCAAGLATIEVYEKDDLIENARKMGAYLGGRLEEIKSRHVSVGDVRYIGLFSAIELVQDRGTKQPIEPKMMSDVNAFLKKNGLFTFIMANQMGSILFIVPPLCINQVQMDEGLLIIEQAIDLVDRSLN